VGRVVDEKRKLEAQVGGRVVVEGTMGLQRTIDDPFGAIGAVKCVRHCDIGGHQLEADRDDDRSLVEVTEVSYW
jgi:hypothetical protein